jgi:hypothetical protein
VVEVVEPDDTCMFLLGDDMGSVASSSGLLWWSLAVLMAVPSSGAGRGEVRDG